MTIEEYEKLKSEGQLWKPSPPPNIAIWFDVDGTLRANGEHHRDGHWHILNYSEVQWIEGAREAMLKAYDYGFYILWVSNQTGIGEGIGTDQSTSQIFQQMRLDMVRYIYQRSLALHKDVRDIHRRISYLFCSHHHESEGCECMKPKPGMLIAHTIMFDLDKSRSFMIGNEHTDILAGCNAGLPQDHCMLVDNYSKDGLTTLDAVNKAIAMSKGKG